MFKKLLNRKKRKQQKKAAALAAANAIMICPWRHLSFSTNNMKIVEQEMELHNCQIIANTRFVIDGIDKLFFTSGEVPNYSLQQAAQKWKFCEEDFQSCIFNKEKNEIIFRIKSAEQYLTGTTVYASNYEPNNLYHFFMDCIFDAIFAKDKGIKIDNIVTHKSLIPRFREILTKLFPEAKIINAETGEIVTVEKLILFPKRNVQWHWIRKNSADEKQTSIGRHFFNEEYLRSLQKTLFAAFEIKPGEQNSDRAKMITFIPRKSNFRNTLNQDELENLLRNKCPAKQLTILDPATASFSEIGTILSKTDLLICQEGAALFNIIFANKINMAILTWPLFDKTKQDSIYEEIANMLHHKFKTIPASWHQVKCDEKNGFSEYLSSESLSDLIVPLDLVEQFLNDFFKSDQDRKI